ncbi:MAG: M23 family metallopeptidase [Chroococcales cyanobacterium]
MIRYRSILLAVVSCLTLILLSGLIQPGLEAKDTSSLPVATNIWRSGTFPVEQFQGYTSPFGYRRSATGGGGQEFHRGLDIAAPEGSYIRNWWPGEVVDLSDHTACGTLITIQSGSWKHIYCHLKGHVESNANGRYLIDRQGGIQIWLGQQIPGGVRIGRVGMTGRTTGPHLHWGLKYGDRYIDPGDVLKEMFKNA